MKRKIEAMHQLFGYEDGFCKDCSNFSEKKNEYFKCKIYGKTRSEATDWRKSYTACGLFNKEYSGDVEIIEYLNRGKKAANDEQIPGQMSIEDFI